MTGNKGSISVEALVSVTVFILFMSFLFQILSMFSKEDKISQIVFDEIYNLENHGYLYEKVGVLDHEITLESKEHNEIIEFINSSIRTMNHTTKAAYLKSVLLQAFEPHELMIDSFELSNDTLSCSVSYHREYVFGMSHKFDITIKKRMWLFGDEKELYPNRTLSNVYDNQLNNERNQMVYQTKTGGRYHLQGCFYLVRSTTDHSKIKEISLYDAKYIYHMMPCKRCIKEVAWK